MEDNITQKMIDDLNKRISSLSEEEKNRVLKLIIGKNLKKFEDFDNYEAGFREKDLIAISLDILKFVVKGIDLRSKLCTRAIIQRKDDLNSKISVLSEIEKIRILEYITFKRSPHSKDLTEEFLVSISVEVMELSSMGFGLPSSLDPDNWNKKSK